MKIFKFIVSEEDPKRLGPFLSKKKLSKQAIVNAKHNGGMLLVNHRRRFTNFTLKVGDEVLFVMGKEKVNNFLKASNKSVKIVLETDNYLVINKPAAVLSIPSRYEDKDAVVNRVMGYFAKKKGSEQAFLKPHIVTRLDRDTSGLVLVGKNAVAHSKFSELKKDVFVKEYHAIVHGNFNSEHQKGLITAPIGKIDDSVKRYVTPNGQKSVTQYEVLAQKDDASLVKLRLFTGRTHQIRVHMAHIGHPLFGDKLYGSVDNFTRQALNCSHLSFPDPFTDEKVTVEIDDPEDMAHLWQNL